MLIAIAILVVLALLIPILVLVHEFGHFAVAKKLGIKVEEFGFGFPPKIWKKKVGETLYTINLLPFGGFVKLFGEDEAGGGKITFKQKEFDKSDLKRAFFARPAHQRAAVVVAGVVMNVFLAAAVYYIYFAITNFKAEIPLLNDYKFIGTNQSVRTEIVIGEIAENSPAQKAGIAKYSKILSVKNSPVGTLEQFKEMVDSNRGKQITISWQELETNAKKEATVIPRLNPPKNEGALGVGLSTFDIALLNYETPIQKLFSGFVHPYNLMSYNLNIMGMLFSLSLEKKTVEPLSEGLSGPVGIVVFVGQILKIGEVKEVALQLLNLTGLLSISLAFFNILPIPALDGGRLFFILIEMFTGKKVPEKYEQIAHTVGFAILITLLILVTFKDITRTF